MWSAVSATKRQLLEVEVKDTLGTYIIYMKMKDKSKDFGISRAVVLNFPTAMTL